MSNRHNPTEPHPFAHELRVTDEWREMQAEMKAEQGCTGDECGGCPECSDEICSSCNGTGDAYIPRDGRMAARCGSCGGSGVTNKEQSK